MKKIKRNFPSFLVMIFTVIVFCFFCITSIFAVSGENPVNKPIGDEIFGGSGITWVPKVNYAKLELRVSRPDGSVFQKIFDSGSTPYLDLSDIYGEGASDGSYTYELRVLSRLENRNRDENIPRGRKLSGTQARFAPLTQTGYILVRGGMIMNSNISEPRNAPNTAQDGLSRTNDQVILDDLIVDGSACIGFDCYNGESFGFDTLRLKENNLRIKFQDTSSTATFPTNDWQITANDSSDGGANKFSIDDIDSGKTPFTIEAGTRANALYVDDSGRVGLGTSTPSEDLHIWYGDTPTVRLHQSGSGWAPQTWDIAGNEANFFIRDVTNGSRLSFRIKPGAPTNSIFINNNGYIGFGTQSPAYPLELETTGEGAEFLLERTDGASGTVCAGLQYVFIGSKSNHDFRLIANDDAKMAITTSGNVGIGIDEPGHLLVVGSAGTTYCDGNDWHPTSSREYKENIHDLTVEDAMEALSGLNPVRYNYKTNKAEERVGFIAEDVPELVAINGRKNVNPMDILGVLTKVVQQQQKMMQEQQKTIDELNKKIAELEKKSH